MKTVGKILGATGIVLAVVFAAGAERLIVKTTAEQYNAADNKSSLDRALMQTTDGINADLPLLADSDIRLDAAFEINRKCLFITNSADGHFSCHQ